MKFEFDPADLPEVVQSHLETGHRPSDGLWLVRPLENGTQDCIRRMNEWLPGPSGAGKTTLLKLMLGLLTPASGSVRLGGRSLNQIGLRNFRSHVATVMQDDQLFSGTILENITFMSAKPDLELVSECCVAARINAEILAMPMGYHTLVGDMGTVLSGGQKQRVLLARALYRRPRILVLDEATSHLDVEGERAIGEAISRLKITRVMIAHRRETIAIAERIVRFDAGKLVPVDREAYLFETASAVETSLPSLRDKS